MGKLQAIGGWVGRRANGLVDFTIKALTLVGLLYATCELATPTETPREAFVNVAGEVAAKAVVELSRSDLVIEMKLPSDLETAALEALERVR